ncbi:hypothetical protein PR048_011536 [Dryococelus australis]|uniref:HTH psq-type domain-containing protein n=1 Tax=Dryococelus australis TaxID=614101 RepID=A0ABQ9HMG8_9NEOP|nr:hypothetical protein PR048_011536 [Dryococelus australis]
MRRALTDIAAREFNVPLMTLKRHYKGENTYAGNDVKTLGC